jgi:hypothetical protein
MNLELVLAQYALDQLPGEATPAVADALIEQGFISAAASELSCLHHPTWRDARELFLEAIAAAGLEVPTCD